jgi:beta-lactam-binding protein with PASTA domain
MNEASRMLANRYQVGELIGRGGMAEVHIGYDTRLGRTVAIKVLRPDLARDPSFQTRFRREAQAAAGLNHPAIVAVYDTGEEQIIAASGERQILPFIVMEYVEGHTVRDILKEGAAAPIDEAIEIVAGVLTGLEYAHAAGLVHRDIKPANIMLTPTGAVKVMDFGIARVLADVGQTMTQTQAVIGTAQYLSPEQARGENVDARSDLYSTGCVLFELLCGRPPVLGDSPVSVAYQHVREPAPTPSSFAPDVPPALDQVVMRALAKDREARYASAQEFLADLSAVAQGRPLDIATGQYPVGSASHGSGATAVLAAATGATGITQVMPGGGGYPGDLDDELVETPNGRARQIRNALILVGSLLVAGLIIFGLLNLTKPKDSEATGTIAVPNVVELAQTAAVNLLAEYELEAEAKFEASADIPKGFVIRSNPAVNVVVDKGSTVVIYVSTGPAEATVPKVNGLIQTDAEDAIVRAGLVVKEVLEDNSDPTISAGRATRTDPAEGTVVTPDTPVTLYISSGKVQLPDVTNKSLEEATAILAALGLAVEAIEQQTDAKPPGTVLSQNPQPGLINQGTGIQLTVATAVVYHAVPGLVGKDESNATAAVKALNFVPNVTRQNSLTVPEGTVISQSPAKDTQLAEGQTVSFVVSLGPPIVPTPSPTP